MTRILIIENETRICQMITKAISKYDSFTILASVKKPTDIIDKDMLRDVDVIFTDISPNSMGLNLLRMAKSKNPNMRPVIISKCQSFSMSQAAAKYHVFEYMIKPVGVDEIEDVLRRLALVFSYRDQFVLAR